MATKYAALVMVAALLWTAPASARPVKTISAACTLLKAKAVAKWRIRRSIVADCDPLLPQYNPPGYYVMSLQSSRRCDGICSKLMGWFAVRRKDGWIYEYDVAEDRVGKIFSR